MDSRMERGPREERRKMGLGQVRSLIKSASAKILWEGGEKKKISPREEASETVTAFDYRSEGWSSFDRFRASNNVLSVE